MKKRNLFIATLLVVAATTVAVVSCKKETQASLLGNSPQPVKTFTPPKVDDMNAYLKDFKQKMQTATRGENETLDIEEAAWYLSSVANYDFANVNVEFTDLRYDTLHYHVNVTNGQVSLNDLNALYTTVANDIDAFYQNLNLEEKHFRFIGASISNSGAVEVSLMTSFRSLNHTWYFTDWFEAGVACDSLFSDDEIYVWNDLAVRKLNYIMNLWEGRAYVMPENPPVTTRAYYLYLMDVVLEYQDYTDLYGSPFVWNSRLFVALCGSDCVPELSPDMMCYCLDSYLELPYQYISTHADLINVHPVRWNIRPRKFLPNGAHDHIFCHDLKVTLATYVTSTGSIEY